MNIKHYTSLLFIALAFSACKQSQEPISEDTTKKENKFTVEINGTFHMPEWVDLESGEEDQAKAFTLRPNAQGYPKIRLSGIEDNNLAFETFPSSVWIYNQTSGYNFRIDVEDSKQESHTLTGTNKSNGSSAANRGISRIIKKGDKYHAMVKYEVSGKQGQPSSYSGENYPSTYPTGTRAFVAFGHYFHPQGTSVHRLYMPKIHDVKVNSAPPQMDPLTHIPQNGDFVVAENSISKSEGKNFKLPFISKYADLSTIEAPTKAVTNTNFYMAGALLALRFKNNKSSSISIRKIHVKSNNLAFSGFYELWHNHPDQSNNLPQASRTRPFFARTDGGTETPKRRNTVYAIPIQNSNGGPHTLNTGSTSSGRFYLWGGIDELTANTNGITQIQVEYSIGTGTTTYKTKIINIAPKTAPNRFEEGKAYIITVPVQ